MTLVTNGPRGYPHAVAMFFVLGEDAMIRFATYASSQKVRNIERDPRVTLLVEAGSSYAELRGVMIEGRAGIERDPDRTLATMIEANAGSGHALPDPARIPPEVKERMVGKRVLVTVRPERFVSWDHGKLPAHKTPAALRNTLG